MRRRLRNLEGGHQARPDEREGEKWRERIRQEAARMNEARSREGREPVFEISKEGEVFCVSDGRPVEDFHQTLAEDWYWQQVEWGPGRLVHDEEAEAFYTPEGELALSRRYCHLGNLFRCQ